MKISLLIIAGGKSSRLGRDKRFVEVGGIGLLENILRKAAAQNFAEIFLCIEENSLALKTLAEKFGAKILVDEIRDAGPMAGLANGLARIKTDWALAVSADMPFFEFDAVFPLIKKFSSAQAIIPICGGKIQPLAGFYRREAAKIFSLELLSGQRKLFTAIKKIPHEFAELSGDENFFNVNTPADLRLARGRAENISRKTPIISVVAPNSGTGKTTFIARLVKIFSAKKISVGVIKSTHHKIGVETFAKDSSKFRRAGASKIYVGENFFEAIENFSGVDLIFTEGRTKNFFPTISLWRGNGAVIADEKVCAIFTSATEASDEIYQFNLYDMIAAEKICCFLSGYSMLQISRPQFSH